MSSERSEEWEQLNQRIEEADARGRRAFETQEQARTDALTSIAQSLETIATMLVQR